MSRRVLYIQYTSPASWPVLGHSAVLMSRAGYDITFFGIEAAGQAGRLVLDLECPAKEILWTRARQGLAQKLHFIAFTFWALFLTIRSRAAWVYASDLYSSPAAFLVKKLGVARVLYHEHDSVTDFANQSQFMRVLMTCRRWLAQNADVVVLPNADRIRQVQRDLNVTRKIHCAWNCPLKSEAGPPRRPPEGELLDVLYHGSIVADRLPIALLDALKMLRGRVRLRIAGYATGAGEAYLGQLLARVESEGLQDYVHYLGALSHRRDLLKLIKEADVGLSFMPVRSGDVNMDNMTGASQKTFEYLALGVPLLVTDRADWRRMIVEPGYGLACDPHNPASIAETLSWYIEHPDLALQMGEQGRLRVMADWNYEAQFAPVLADLNVIESGFESTTHS